MNFINGVQIELRLAMKARDKRRVNALKNILADVTYASKLGPMESMNDFSNVAMRGIKKRMESIALFETAGRVDLAENERNEISIWKEFLPTELSENQLREHINKAIESTGAKSVSDMGKIMKVLTGNLNPAEAPRSQLSKLLKEELTKRFSS